MKSEITHASGLVRQYFGLEEAPSSKEHILEVLTEQVRHLLDHDFQSLLNALYRIDVDEARFKQVLAISPATEVSREVANLIFERIMEKAKFRMKYGS